MPNLNKWYIWYLKPKSDDILLLLEIITDFLILNNCQYKPPNTQLNCFKFTEIRGHKLKSIHIDTKTTNVTKFLLQEQTNLIRIKNQTVAEGNKFV